MGETDTIGIDCIFIEVEIGGLFSAQVEPVIEFF